MSTINSKNITEKMNLHNRKGRDIRDPILLYDIPPSVGKKCDCYNKARQRNLVAIIGTGYREFENRHNDKRPNDKSSHLSTSPKDYTLFQIKVNQAKNHHLW